MSLTKLTHVIEGIVPFPGPAVLSQLLTRMIDPRNIKGTGPQGRILKGDLLGLSDNSWTETATESIKQVPSTPSVYTPSPTPADPISGIPHYYLDLDISLAKLSLMINETHLSDTNVQPVDFIVRAAGKAAEAVPQIMSTWMGDSVRQYSQHPIRLHTSFGRSAVVPHKATVGKISSLRDTIEVSDTELTPSEDVSLSVFDIIYFPQSLPNVFKCWNIVKTPASSLLAIGAPREKVKLKPGATPLENVGDSDIDPYFSPSSLTTEPILRLSMAFDHRVVDGAVGAQFMAKLKSFIENPGSLF